MFPPGKSGGLIEALPNSRSRRFTGSLFPPGKSGGLIEARSRSATVAMAAKVFPPGKSGGLIEARRIGRISNLAFTFPPGKSGGLIEAQIDSQDNIWLTTRFRGVNPAASLKQGAFFGGQIGGVGEFPPAKSGGLIEATSR